MHPIFTKAVNMPLGIVLITVHFSLPLGFVFDVAYTSYLKRAIRTLWHTLEQTELMYIPIINAWELNER